MSFDLLSYPVSQRRSSILECTLVASGHGLHFIFALHRSTSLFPITTPLGGGRKCAIVVKEIRETVFLGKRPIRNVKSYHFVEQHLLISTLMW